MIGVIGFAKVILNDEKLTERDLNKDENNLKIKVIKEIKPRVFELKFFILMNDSSDNHRLDDYVSIVHPNLESVIKGLLTLVEIIEIKNLGPQPIRHISEI